MENIVDEFKKYAKELGTLYRTRKELDSLIEKYETKLKSLGEVLEFADSAELSYRAAEEPAQQQSVSINIRLTRSKVRDLKSPDFELFYTGLMIASQSAYGSFTSCKCFAADNRTKSVGRSRKAPYAGYEVTISHYLVAGFRSRLILSLFKSCKAS